MNIIMQWFSECDLGTSEVSEILAGNMQDQEFFCNNAKILFDLFYTYPFKNAQ